MRRLITVLIAAAAVVAGPGIAHADPTTVVSRNGLPTGFTFATGATGCTNSPHGSDTHQAGPGTPPLGEGSLQLNIGAGSAAEVDYDLSGDGAADALTSFSVYSYLPAVGAPNDAVMIIFLTDKNNADLFYQGRLELPSEVAEWKSSDLIASSSTVWTSYNSDTSMFTPIGTESYASFLASYDVSLGHIAIEGDACPVSGSPVAGHFNIDDIGITYDSTTSGYDFEAPVATSLTAHVSKSSVAYHGAVTPSVTLTSEGAAFPARTVTLLKKPAGAKTFTKVGTATTNPKGVATGPVQHPTTNTAYEWTFAADNTFAAATSATKKIAVGSSLTLDLAHSSVPAGSKLEAGGTVTPRHTGDKITLWAKSGSHKKKVGTSKLRKDGTYQVSGKLPAGHYSVYAIAAATSTNATGQSATKKFTVRR